MKCGSCVASPSMMRSAVEGGREGREGREGGREGGRERGRERYMWF